MRFHPESSGRLERFHRSTRDRLDEEGFENLTGARRAMGRGVEHNHHERLHAALGYLPPVEYYAGEPAARQKERNRKLEEGRRRREAADRQLAAAA